MSNYSEFNQALLKWFDSHGRKNLPWQLPRSAYRVWISEIMLQQTQVQTVIPYFNRFMESFPDAVTLAQASMDDVLAHWSGLGYYSRGRNIYHAAQIICHQYNGELPSTLNELISLPGIGPSTAAAIVSQAFNQPAAILDGNVKRVLSRYFMVEGHPEQSKVKNKLWELARACMPRQRCADYTQAIMDLGALCCTSRKPDCLNCPVKSTCLAFQHGQVINYPHKKQKKVLPDKYQQFFILYNSNNQIFLEKRPPTGLWGGLWCLPNTGLDNEPDYFLKNDYGFECNYIQYFQELKHTFSHFHLHITAYSAFAEPNFFNLKETNGQWFDPVDLAKLGLAKPISKLINDYLDNRHLDG